MNYINEYKKYKFLLQQLVARDFKSKYKRSILGILWSLLNPLLLMMVQYIVFSALFRFDIQYYPVYLLIGIVMFNFFSEATGQALVSITGNAGLITKVNVPKYIFPVSKVLSSCINLGFSLVVLIPMILIAGIPVTPKYFLLPFGVVNLIVFTVGFSLILSSVMVFFRDTQFLYGVMIMLWMYLTPIFYPEDIIGPRFEWMLQLNPLYHFIRYTRNIILDDSIPTLRAHIFCIIFAFGMLLIGKYVFNKVKDRFIFNL